MEKLTRLSNFPQIKTITSALVLQSEAKIYFDDFENNKYEVHFPIVYDFRQCVEVAFISRKFQFCPENKFVFSGFRVEDSDWIKSFIESSDGAYGDNLNDYQHFIMFDSIDARIEIIATRTPVISKI